MKAQVRRELDRLELLIEQIKGVEAERDELFAEAKSATPTPAATLLDIKGIGPEFAAILWTEAFYRNFANRKQVAAYAGLGADALAKWVGKSRARRFESRQSAIEDNAHPARLAMAAQSATIGARPVV